MRFFCPIFIIVALMISVFLNTDIVYVDAVKGGKVVLGTPSSGVAQFVERATSSATPNITARAAVVADGETGEILYAKNMAAKIPLASITKLMSLLVLTEKNLDWDEVVALEDSDFDNLRLYIGPDDKISLLGLGAGSKIKFRDLIFSALIKSANDAMAAAVRAAGFNFFAFAKEMNNKALELGMTLTDFDEPTGLSINNITTAGDLILLAGDVFENKIIQEITSQQYYYLSEVDGSDSVSFDSTNKLFQLLEGTSYKVIAGKTGYLDESGYNFLVEVKNGGGKKYIIVVLGSESDEGRFDDAYKLLLWAENSQ